MARSSDRRRLALLTCCFGLFMAQLDATIVNVGLPSIQRGLGADIAGLQWVVDAYVLVLGSLAISAGAAGDRLGRRRVFRVGLVTFTLASLGCGLAPALGVLVAFRALQGAGAAMLMPSTLAIIADVFTEPRERAAAIGTWAGVAGLSMVAGPLLGGALVDGVGWRALFWVNLPVGVLALRMAARFVPESRAPRPRALDLRGQALLVGALALLTFALIEAPGWGWASAPTLGLLGLAIAAAALFAAVERRAAEPLLDPRLLRRPALGGASAFAVLAYAATAGFLFLNTLYLQQVRGYSPLRAGLAILPMTVAVAIAAPLAGRLAGRGGPRPIIAGAGLLIAAAMGVLATVSPGTPYPVLLVAYALLGVGWGTINPPITTLAISALPRARSGLASAVAGSARQVGALVGVALMGSLVAGRLASTAGPGEFTSAIHLGYLVGVGAGAGIVLLAWAIPLRGPGRQAAAPPGTAGRPTSVASSR